MAFLTGYSYRKLITLSRASGAVTNYQMKLLVGESSGATGEDVDCGGHCQADFDDLRFTAADGVTLLDFWIESISGATPNQLATVWIEFNSIGTGATTFYMYYGNAGASAASNGANTFLFFDDFPGSSLSAQWNESQGTPTVSSGAVALDSAALGSQDAIRATGIAFLNDIRMRSRFKVSTDKNHRVGMSNSALNANFQADDSRAFFKSGTANVFKGEQANEGTSEAPYSLTGALDTYEIMECLAVSGSSKFNLNNGAFDELTTNPPNENMYPRMDAVAAASSGALTVDWFFISQYLATEPAWGSWGSEQIITELTPGTLALTLSGHAPTVQIALMLTPGTLQLTLTGHAPTVGLGLTPGTLALTLSGYAPVLTFARPQMAISGIYYPTIKGSISIDNRIEERSVAKFSIPDDEFDYYFRRGQPVKIEAWESLSFGGVIDTPGKESISPDGAITHEIQCADWHYLADKRKAIESYLAQTCGYIFQDLVTKYLAVEGVTVGEIQAGPVILEAIVPYVSLTVAFNALKKKAGFTWWIDSAKRIYFVARATYVAPWAVTRADMLKSPRPRWTGGNPQYRNTQYILGGKSTTVLQTETRRGDGIAQSFVMGFPLALVPTVTVGGVAKTVGIKGLDTGKDFYWSKGDAVIYAEVPPADAASVVIQYYGQYKVVIKSSDDSQIAAQAAIEGAGSGIVEDVINDDTVSSLDAGFELAAANLSEFCKDAEQFVFATVREGLQVGQLATITHLPFGLDAEQMLISAVNVKIMGPVIIYTVTTVKGPVIGSWAQLFNKLGDKGVINSLDIGSDSTLTLISNQGDTWSWTDNVVITENAAEFPDAVLYPGSDVYPA